MNRTKLFQEMLRITLRELEAYQTDMKKHGALRRCKKNVQI